MGGDRWLALVPAISPDMGGGRDGVLAGEGRIMGYSEVRKAGCEMCG